MNVMYPIRVGSRKSELAMRQTYSVIDRLKEFSGHEHTFQVVPVVTIGDRILDKPLPKIGEKSLFTKELEIALINKEVDFIVHSLKDLPTQLPDGLTIAAVLVREDPRDAVILHDLHSISSISDLPAGSVIGTSSLRRRAQLMALYPHLKCEDIRGNLNTRLAKLNSGKYDGLILAAAGVTRMGWQNKITELLSESTFMYAVGQGALAVECRLDDAKTCPWLSRLHHEPTLLRCVAERAFLRRLEGGCHAPIGVCSSVTKDTHMLTLKGGVYNLSGTVKAVASASCLLPHDGNGTENSNVTFSAIRAGDVSVEALSAAEQLGFLVASKVQELGGTEILKDLSSSKSDDNNNL